MLGNLRSLVLGSVILLLAGMLCISLLLQILGCVIYDSYWPMISFILYVFVPMPHLFFGSSGDTLYDTGGGWWVDWGKFLTGFSGIGLIAIPASLFHAQYITLGALLFELSGALVLFAVVFVYDYFSLRDGYLM